MASLRAESWIVWRLAIAVRETTGYQMRAAQSRIWRVIVRQVAMRSSLDKPPLVPARAFRIRKEPTALVAVALKWGENV